MQPSNSFRILLVDDDPDDLLLLRDLLNEVADHDFDVQWASSAEDGFRILHDDRFDVCIVDYRLGLGSGIEFIESANAYDFELPFILWTGASFGQIEAAALAAGAVDLIDKDKLTAQRLARAIRFAVEQLKRLAARKANKLADHVTLIEDLRKAVRDREFEIYLQPQVRCADGRITSAEALVRWNRPGVGLVAPDAFIGQAEECGLIVEIGKQVLEQACQASRDLSWLGYDITLAVNVSVVQLERKDFVQCVEDAILRYNADPGRLELEITESAAMQDPESVLAQMTALKKLGIRFSIDDFGTGFSSFTTLLKFPFDCIKIDRSFFASPEVDAQNKVVTRAIYYLAHGLGLETVSEGVETQEQLDFVHTSGGSHAQGYLFSKPVPYSQFVRLLEPQAVVYTPPVGTAYKWA